PLCGCVAAAAVRCVCLVRRDLGRDPVGPGACPAGRPRHLSVRAVGRLRYAMLSEIDYVLAKLDWMRAQRIWPNGLRYLWTDAFGLVLLVSLYRASGEQRWLDQAEDLVADVERVLGRPRGLRIGEAPDRDGQYFHYLAMWLFALARLGDLKTDYRARGIAIAHDIHKAFVMPGRGVLWKMTEDLRGPYPGYGLGAMDAY